MRPRRPAYLAKIHPAAPRPATVLAIVVALAATWPLSAGPTTSVAWENLDGTSTPASAALRDEDGATLLSAGGSGSGDGALLALGYFTGATTSATFQGDWVPLTGPQAGNIPFQRTTVGDASEGPSLGPGFFAFQTDFDSSNSAVYQRIPPAGTRLAIAIYNGSTIANSTRFNIVTHETWQWEEPHPVLPTLLYLNPLTEGALWFGGEASARSTTVPTSSFPGNAARAPARLINISTRGFVGTGAAQLIPGFVIHGSGSCRLLIRAVGPTLARFDVANPLPNPVLRVIRQSDRTEMASNDDWSTQADPAAVRAAFGDVGAFSLPEGSTDAALLTDLTPSLDGYTVQVAGNDGGSGVAIAEVYLTDLDPESPVGLINISTRGHVGAGSEIMIAGFVVGPGGPRRLLIRAAGPTLASKFGLPDTLADPRIEVHPLATPNVIVASNEDWGDLGQAAALSAAAAQVSAFSLGAGSQDAGLLLDLPGSDREQGYTVQVSGASGGTGLVITEIYELP